jgi:cystathionine beta-lyase
MSIKYDYHARRGKPADAYPMWVADMDFRSPPCVRDALARCAGHGVFGYSDADSGYSAALTNWFGERFGWSVKPEWNTVTGGVVPSLYIAVRAFTKPGDAVLVQPPVYYPFFSAVRGQGRELLENRLVLRDGRYEMDFNDFESKAAKAKLFILCSPHNPVGRVWTREELARVGEICLKHGVIVISDEIHADFVYGINRLFLQNSQSEFCKKSIEHTPYARVSDELSESCVICTAPSKTFNLAGLQLANILIPNDILRRKFQKEYDRTGLSQGSLPGMVACKAAYEAGGGWLDNLLIYLADNIAEVRNYLRGGRIRLIEPQGTYLLWLDCRELGLSDPALDAKFLGEYKLWLDAGTMFGSGGSGFMRMNVALPRSELCRCLSRIK